MGKIVAVVGAVETVENSSFRWFLIGQIDVRPVEGVVDGVSAKLANLWTSGG